MTSTVSTPRLIVGTNAYFATQENVNWVPHDFSDYDAVPRKFMPINILSINVQDAHYINLQQKMMDFGWRLNENDDGKAYFTHPTYDGNSYSVYIYKLSNGKDIMLPLVERDADPKGLGCSVEMKPGAGHHRVETNEWQSYWDSRTGKRKATQLSYQDKRAKKREHFIAMAKTDPSVKVWDKDTPRCDPQTWSYNSSNLNNLDTF
tara:strand:- start:1702 stop:2316 length:615 start_codon:yes stop_codon:yes gene_type:complete